MRAPDISWVQKVRLARFSRKDFKKFLPLCPDFVLKLRSESDSLSAMEEYMANGARLGWLLEPMRKQALFTIRGKIQRQPKNPGSFGENLFSKGSSLICRKSGGLWNATEADSIQRYSVGIPQISARPCSACTKLV
jgi:hypothetical protein